MLNLHTHSIYIILAFVIFSMNIGVVSISEKWNIVLIILKRVWWRDDNLIGGASRDDDEGNESGMEFNLDREEYVFEKHSWLLCFWS